jgi:hypothetical protein
VDFTLQRQDESNDCQDQSAKSHICSLQPECIRRPPRVAAALEHAGLLIGNDRADGAGEPCPVRPPSDLVAKAPSASLIDLSIGSPD